MRKLTTKASIYCLVLAILLHFVTVAQAQEGHGEQTNNQGHQETSNHSQPTHSNHEGQIAVAGFNFTHVETPFIITAFLILTIICKIAFHRSKFLTSTIPESVLLICVGTAVGGILSAFGIRYTLETTVFFQFLLPPIMLESGYFLYNRVFFGNLGTILLFAFIGTLFNAMTIGSSLFGCVAGGLTGLVPANMTYLHSLVFGSLISAVDPVAVIAVFDDVHVNEQLYFLVFGESLLNDAVTVVLYKLMYALSILPTIEAGKIALGIFSMFVVSIGGITIGLLLGMAAAYVTKFTKHVEVLEPMFILAVAYASYLTAEMFEWSGIMSIATCGLALKHYAESNISNGSLITLKYFLKSLSSSAESIIFLFLGLSLFKDDHHWDVGFILWTLLFCLVYRALGVVIFTFLANKFRENKIGFVDQFIMSYGGLRGAVAFSLAVLLNSENVPTKNLMTTTALVVILFTVFIQGSTIKPLVNLLKVKRKEEKTLTINEQIQLDLFSHVKAGIEEITGEYSESALKNIWNYYDDKYFKKVLQREPECGDFDIIHHYEKLTYQDAAKKLMKSVRQTDDDDVQLALMKLQSPEGDESSTHAEPIHMEDRRLSAEPAASIHSRSSIHTHHTAITLERISSTTRPSLTGDNFKYRVQKKISKQYEGRYNYHMKPSQEDAAQRQLKSRQRWSIAYAKQTDIVNQLRNRRLQQQLPQIRESKTIRNTEV